MEIKDLAGISQPITKLIEEVSKGIGGAYKPLGTVLQAKAEEYKIKCLTDAKLYQIKTLKEDLTDEENELVVTNENFEIKLKGNSIEERALETMIRKEVQSQINLDSIINKAIEFIEENSTVKDEPVETDWMTRFINISQDISNEEMQNLWAKILSNEVANPNSYSLRTLEVLKSLSTSEARLFTKFVDLGFKLSTSKNSSTMVINNREYLNSNNISLDDLNLLKELNLINTELSYTIKSNEKMNIIYFDKGLFIENNTEKDVWFHVATFSRIGNEINSLIKKNFEIKNLINIGKHLKSNHKNVSGSLDIYCANGTWENDDKFSYIPENKIIIN